MQTPPFFRLSPPGTELPAARPARYPYHDNTDCSIGQEVKRSGQWQGYAPTQIAETRVRCANCVELSREGNG